MVIEVGARGALSYRDQPYLRLKSELEGALARKPIPHDLAFQHHAPGALPARFPAARSHE